MRSSLRANGRRTWTRTGDAGGWSLARSASGSERSFEGAGGRGLLGRAPPGLGARVVILGGTVFTGWDIVLFLLLYVALPLLLLISLIVGVVMFVRRARR